ncbi:MAG: histone H1 [Planctomycetes bacterium]|nr:histone H1 [Planctomycetota bacterium]
MTQNYERLVQLVTTVREDFEKAQAGNKAAQTRVRKAMQDVKNLAQDIRKEMLEVRDGGNGPAKPA